MLEETDKLAKLSVPELAKAYVENVLDAEATEHVGRANRLARAQSKIVAELKARGEVRSVFEELANHSNATVNASAKSRLAWLNRPPAEPLLPPPPQSLRPEIVWQCDHPPPPALPREAIAEHLRQSVPLACDRLMQLARPAIGLWPQRRAAIAATASRLGGAPLAPPGWQWPLANEEPRLFVGQINCAELHGLPGSQQLPSAGLLCFFGDHDAVTGCFPFDDECVFFWPDAARLVPAHATIEPIEVFPSCALTPYPFVDLPYPDSDAVRTLGFDEQERKSYFDVWLQLRGHGIPSDCVYLAGFSKLFGWPALVQSDLGDFESNDNARLLLQVDHYCNGEASHHWGPGGSLFYVLSERDLRARNFGRCQLEGQFT
jgi:uncharacterized protein YwqG